MLRKQKTPEQTIDMLQRAEVERSLAPRLGGGRRGPDSNEKW